ncbi:nitrate reductase [Pleomorphovibrio marinus]|uniref:nitrate reductase n=1 Tax=Pleomorphovibrio marinus TaxID=2164132 RepID=UPI000E0A29C3|nr:nitrate reductase [Pleomorphovibrio marinus]
MKKPETYKSTCSYCGVGCGILIHTDKKGQLKVTGDPDHPVNKGMLCSKGMNLNHVVNDTSDRLQFPQMRWGKEQPLERVDWDTALGRGAAVFRTLVEKYGSDSVGFYISGQCLTEEYYLINKLVKGYFKTNNIDTNSRLCMSAAVIGHTQVFGEDIVPVSYEDIELADCFFVAGANPAWCHPILWRRIEKHKERYPDVKIVVVDPRHTQSCELADLHLQIKPGTDTTLYRAMARCLIEEGEVDISFIENHTDGFELYKERAFAQGVEEAAVICDVSSSDIRKAARWIGNAKGFISLWAMGLNQSGDGVNRNHALLALSLLTGQIGKPGAGPLSLTGQSNAMGGREVGGMATLLAAHKKLANPIHRKEVADFWGVGEISKKPGLTATEMVEALETGSLKAIWIVCTNPLVSMPDSRRVEKALKKARFVVVQDISKNASAIPYADLVLPAAGWAEKEGTMTNSERRIGHLSKAVQPPGEALPDTEIVMRFAKKMGFNGFDFDGPAEIFAEHAALTKGSNIDISELDYKTLKQKGAVQWPYFTNGKEPSRPFTNGQFATENGRAKLISDGPFHTPEPEDPTFPLVLTSGRLRDQWHTMTRTGKVNRLNQHAPAPYLEIHPDDAEMRGITDGKPVVIHGHRGEVKVNARVSPKMKKGVVFLPMHWGKVMDRDFSRTNNLTGNGIDPVSKQPDFKFSRVQVSPFIKPKQRIVVVGAGAAAYRFIQTYRELNTEDEIYVFSQEKHPFYNRVLLPDYVSKHKTWQDLQKFKEGEIEKLDIKLQIGNGIAAIDKEQKSVVDEKGKVYSYDLLVMATGSRAFVPPDAPMHLPGVFTMRSRYDADSLLERLNPESHVLIVGGGLLGLELAASLKEMDIEVSIVQLASRLMERQLDPLASSLLKEKMEEMEVNVYLNNQVNQITAKEGLEVQLKGGKSISCTAVVYAIGTRPNVELAKSTGLQCGVGVKINAYMQSSDPRIFALGEIAEFEQKLSGITAAAEQQADIAARYINGDQWSMYRGTIPMNILKFADLDLCSLGIPEVPAQSKGYEEVVFIDAAETYYKKCIVYQDRLVGAILMGDKSEFATFKTLIEDKIELSEKRQELLRANTTKEPPLGKMVCSCGNVGRGNLQKAIEGGVVDFRQLCQSTGAGLGCGSCKPEVKDILNQLCKLPEMSEG